MKTARTAVGLVAMFLMAGSVWAQKVSIDYNRNVDFTKYRTYAWAPSKNPPKDPLWNLRIVEDIERQLNAKGLKRVYTDDADLYVTYDGGIREDVSIQGFGTGGRWLGGSFSVNKVTRKEGTLIVDLLDGPSGQLVWRGIATETVSDKADKNISKLTKVIEKLFRGYPSQAGNKGGRP